MLSYPDFKEKNIVIVFSNEGQKLSFKNDNLIVVDNENKIILQVTCHRLLAIWIVGQCSITSGLLERSKKFAFPILLLSYNFRCIGYWNSATEGNFLLRRIQYQYNSLSIAKHLIHNKILNQIQLLKSIRKKDTAIKEAINNLVSYQNKLSNADNLQEVMGIEGIASKQYFSQWFYSIGWKGRKPRTKNDPINVVLDIGYTQLFYFIENMLHLYGFDIYQGVLHQNFYQRKSLVCDIQEPFRCIVDKIIKNAHNLSQFKEDDFELVNNQYRLKKEKSKSYTQWMLKGIIQYKSDIFLFCQSYYRSFIRQKDIEHYPIFNISSTYKEE